MHEALLAASGATGEGRKGQLLEGWTADRTAPAPGERSHLSSTFRGRPAGRRGGLGMGGTDPHFLPSAPPATLVTLLPFPEQSPCDQAAFQVPSPRLQREGSFFPPWWVPGLCWEGAIHSCKPAFCPSCRLSPWSLPKSPGGLSLTPQPPCLCLAWVEADYCLPMWGPWVPRLKTGLKPHTGWPVSQVCVWGGREAG